VFPDVLAALLEVAAPRAPALLTATHPSRLTQLQQLLLHFGRGAGDKVAAQRASDCWRGGDGATEERKVTLGRWGGRGSGGGSVGWVGLDSIGFSVWLGDLAQMFIPENRWASSNGARLDMWNPVV
jgi:hypothetical protein